MWLVPTTLNAAGLGKLKLVCELDSRHKYEMTWIQDAFTLWKAYSSTIPMGATNCKFPLGEG